MDALLLCNPTYNKKRHIFVIMRGQYTKQSKTFYPSFVINENFPRIFLVEKTCEFKRKFI